MTRTTTAFAAALALFLPIGRPLLVGLTPAVGIGAALLSTKAAYAQSASDLLNSGVDKAQSGNLQGAIADWTKAIEINPMFAKAYFNRGVAKKNLKDYQASIADYTKAIEIDSEYYHAYTNRGIVLEIEGDLKGACKDWKKAAALGDTLPIKWIRNQC
ncbi:tetratricopeptide repeat protein [Synechococcus sp. CC9616]|uniref:tetratricopeptide repeat protein n=1 Tax=Synechococcus sp. CC9616 TaxID=110663 RepID=UPI0004B5A37A|nr:tetratricopeptide repeat protein [Synechococcus sp. CC9616]